MHALLQQHPQQLLHRQPVPQQQHPSAVLSVPRRRLCSSCRVRTRVRSSQQQQQQATSAAGLKQQLSSLVTRLNSAGEADDPQLQQQLRECVQLLAGINPTPRPACSERINARWALLYTCPDASKNDVTRGALNAILAMLYDFFYKNVPIIAGSAVGRKADSRRNVKARGQFQTFDTARGWVENQARFELFGREGVIDVNGPASIDLSDATPGERIIATFTEAELRWGGLRIPFPIKAFSPSGYIDTLYLDEELRVSKGDKGSLFVARRADLGSSG